MMGNQWKFVLLVLVIISLVNLAKAEVIVVEPHISVTPPFPQLAFPTLSYSLNFTLENNGVGDVIASVATDCPLILTCSLSGFTSGTIVEGENKTTTLHVTIPYLILPGEYVVGINVTYDDAYNFAEIPPNYTLSNTTLKVRRAKLDIQSIYIKNVTKIDNYWVLVVQDPHEVSVNVTNNGNLPATGITFIWNLPTGWSIIYVEYYLTIPQNAWRIYKFNLIPTSLGNYTINFTINYTTTDPASGTSLIYSVSSPLFNVSVKDKPIFHPPDQGDIRGNIGISGDLNYLNIFWNTSFIKGSIKDVNITCWLSCDPRITDCSLAQRCRGFKFVDICTIYYPQYNSTLECNAYGCEAGKDKVVCSVNDTEIPQIGSFAALEFKHLAFDLSVLPEATFTVGKSILPVNLRNKGLLKDNYTLSAVSLTPTLVRVNLLEKSIENLLYNQWDGITAEFLFLTGGTGNIYIRANSTTNSNIYKVATLTLRAGYATLSEFEIFGLLQIIFLAGIIFYIFTKFKK